MSSEVLLAHAYDLARELGVMVIPTWAVDVECDECPCGASTTLMEQPMVWVSENPNTAEAYLVFLHELGHHATANLADGQDDLTREHLAWQWAEAQSRIPITPRLGRFIAGRLNSYRD